MTTYKEINGTNIEAVSSDPANPVTGQIWYNTTTNVLKGLGFNATGAWATGGTMNTGREQVSGAGDKTAALAFGGYVAPSPSALTASWNGSSWSEDGDLNAARAGVQGSGSSNTSALAASGQDVPTGVLTEEWTGAGAPVIRTITTD